MKQYKRLLLSFSNISRMVFVSITGVVINYILLRYKAPQVLNGYVYCIMAVNLLMVISNWGGKDYTTKTLSANPADTKEKINSILNSRILLLFIAAVPVFFLPVSSSFKIFILLYLFIKTLSSVFEAVITVQKKFHSFLVIDLILNISFIILILADQNIHHTGLFLAEILLIECTRLLATLIIFKGQVAYKFDMSKAIDLIKDSRIFFFIALSGFICSRADLYVVGIFLEPNIMSRYFIILNLVSLSQVVYATYINTFSSNIFRYNFETFSRFSLLSAKTGIAYALLSAAGIFIISNFYYKLELDLYFITAAFFNISFFTFVLIEMYKYTRLNKQNVILKVLLAAGALNIILSTILTPVFKMPGAFLSNTICMIFTLILFKYHASRSGN